MNRIRVVLVDDHDVVREGIKRLIESEPDVELVGEASDGNEALAKVAALLPHLVMMDISMPHVNGLDATRHIKAHHPEIHVLALTVHEDAGYVREVLSAGASGYLLKRATTEELVRAIRSVAHGATYIDPRIADTVLHALVRRDFARTPAHVDLSDRENEVLRLIAFGFANKEIAAKLEISVKTVETYKARAMEKFGLRSRVDIVSFATERGWFNGVAKPAAG